MAVLQVVVTFSAAAAVYGSVDHFVVIGRIKGSCCGAGGLAGGGANAKS